MFFGIEFAISFAYKSNKWETKDSDRLKTRRNFRRICTKILLKYETHLSRQYLRRIINFLFLQNK